MEPFILYQNGRAADIVLEQNSIYGISYMTEIFCRDIERVCGVYPEIVQELPENSKYAVLIATCGSSELLTSLEQKGLIDLSNVRGRREVYGIFRVKEDASDREFLVVAGSDKRGTIYGMFHLSEAIGVSPWGNDLYG